MVFFLNSYSLLLPCLFKDFGFHWHLNGLDLSAVLLIWPKKRNSLVCFVWLMAINQPNLELICCRVNKTYFTSKIKILKTKVVKKPSKGDKLLQAGVC